MNTTCSIWKPVNMFSNDIIKIAKKTVASNSKVGHAGTLDPFAEGVLVLCFGEKTKDVSKIMAMEKEYVAKIKLGIETDTLDRTGNIYKKSKIPHLDDLDITNVLETFTGITYQTPPAFSALKLNGKCLYEYARYGIRVIKKPRQIMIHSLDLIDYNGVDTITVKVLCGSGTYIRSLASDIAKSLGTHGYLDELQRLRVGKYNRENSFTIKDLMDGNLK